MTTERVHLLQVVPQLGSGLTRSELVEAHRRVVVPVVTVPAGHWQAADLGSMVGDAPLGCIVTEGVIAHDLATCGRVATHLLGPRDVVTPAVPAGRHLPLARLFSVSDGAGLAVLEQAFQAALVMWPAIGQALITHVEEQMARIAVQQLISQLPRAEQRIVALLWHLADSWGRTERDGVVVPLTVGHEAISRLVGGRRPTVSAALGRLADQGLVQRLANGAWLLMPASRSLLDEPIAYGPTSGVRLLGSRHARRANRGGDRFRRSGRAP